MGSIRTLSADLAVFAYGVCALSVTGLYIYLVVIRPSGADPGGDLDRILNLLTLGWSLLLVGTFSFLLYVALDMGTRRLRRRWPWILAILVAPPAALILYYLRHIRSDPGGENVV